MIKKLYHREGSKTICQLGKGGGVRAVESKELIKIIEKMHDNVLSAQKWAIASLLCSATALVVSVILLSLQ